MNTTEFPRYVYLYDNKLHEVAPPLGTMAVRVKLISSTQMEIPTEWLPDVEPVIESSALLPEKL